MFNLVHSARHFEMSQSVECCVCVRSLPKHTQNKNSGDTMTCEFQTEALQIASSFFFVQLFYEAAKSRFLELTTAE
jgi:hypothetical protein